MNLYGFTLADTITRATAHQPNARGRLGGHIDGYLAGSDDPDTYRGGNDRAYWAAESAYTILGGETRPDSEKARDVLADMARNHFTYLNIPPNSGITSRWKAEGFFDDIQRRLGYRFVLDKGQFTKKPKAGKELRVVLNLHNEGFAPVQNPREVELVLTDKAGKHIRAWHVSADPRYWMPGRAVVIDQTVTIPADTSGEVTLWLNLPDPCETLRNNPLFSIRLANDGVWDEEKGYNALYSFTL